MVKGEWITQDNGLIRFRTTCGLCDQPVEVPDLDPAAVKACQDGAYAQDAFAKLSDSLREAIVSGSHARCFDEAFAEDEPGLDLFCDPDAAALSELVRRGHSPAEADRLLELHDFGTDGELRDHVNFRDALLADEQAAHQMRPEEL